MPPPRHASTHMQMNRQPENITPPSHKPHPLDGCRHNKPDCEQTFSRDLSSIVCSSTSVLFLTHNTQHNFVTSIKQNSKVQKQQLQSKIQKHDPSPSFQDNPDKPLTDTTMQKQTTATLFIYLFGIILYQSSLLLSIPYPYQLSTQPSHSFVCPAIQQCQHLNKFTNEI